MAKEREVEDEMRKRKELEMMEEENQREREEATKKQASTSLGSDWTRHLDDKGREYFYR